MTARPKPQARGAADGHFVRGGDRGVHVMHYLCQGGRSRPTFSKQLSILSHRIEPRQAASTPEYVAPGRYP